MLGEFKLIWVCDSEHTLIAPGEPFGAYIKKALYDTVKGKSILFNPSSGKPVKYMWSHNYLAVSQIFPEILEHLVLTGNNGLETWIGLSAEGVPNERLVYDVEANSAAEAVEQINWLTEKLIEEFGPGIKEQVNAAYDGQRLMGTVFPVNMPTPGLEVIYQGAVFEGDTPIETSEIPSVKLVCKRAQELAEGKRFSKLRILEHADAIDIVIGGPGSGIDMVSKGYGVQRVAGRFNIQSIPVNTAYELYQERINPHNSDTVKALYLATRDKKLILGNCTGDGSNDLEAMKRMVLGVTFKYSREELRTLANSIVSNPYDALLASASNLEYLLKAGL